MMTMNQPLTIKADVPYIVVGEWRDEAWFEARRKLLDQEPMTPAERELVYRCSMPRGHPFGVDAWQVTCRVGDTVKTLVFATEDAFHHWRDRTVH